MRANLRIFTLPILRRLKVRMCLATCSNLLLVLYDAPKRFSFFSPWTRQKMMQRPFFSSLHPLSPVTFATATVLAILGSTSTVIHSVKQRLHHRKSQHHFRLISEYNTVLYCIVLRNWPEMMLRPLATYCAKDYKQHSLLQTSFTEPPNRKDGKDWNWKRWIKLITQFTSLYIRQIIIWELF